MNKMVKVILDILIVIACLVFFALTIEMVGSFKYAHREKEDPVETERSVFEYELRHKSYGEVMNTYYVKRMYNFEQIFIMWRNMRTPHLCPECMRKRGMTV